MATVDENLRVWNDVYDWSRNGDEWSADFGGTEALWFFVLYPRIHRFLPAPVILEIAPGYGRWTQFLKDQCRSMIAVDLSERCVEHCKERFVSSPHVQFHVNDGVSLESVPDSSVDFVFSFDSLVHAEKDVIQAYLLEVARKLTRDGVGFIHHSNIGNYSARLKLFDWYSKLPGLVRRHVLTKERLSTLLSINLQAGRAKSMRASLFRRYCQEAGLKCTSQELINWTRGGGLIDTLSVFTRPDSRWDDGFSFLHNGDFITGARLTSRLSGLYCS
jgi:hypothetical protein